MLVINQRLWLPILALGAVGGLAGFLIERTWGDILYPNGIAVGIFFGALLGFTVGLYLQQQKRRWIVGALLVLMSAAAYGTGGIWDALLALASVAITFFISSVVLKDLYGGDEIQAFLHHMRILFAARGGLVIVEKGKIIVPAEKGILFGPRRIIVKPGNVVVMESGSKITRLCGPSIFQSNNFEYIREIIDVGKDRKSLTLTQLLTSDMVPINTEVTYVFGIAISAQTLRGENGSLEQSDGSRGITQSEWQSLRNLATVTPKWQQYVHEVVTGAIREVIASENYQNLTTMTDYGLLANRIQAKARRRLGILGLMVDSTRVVRINPMPQIIDALEDAERTRTREQAGGEAWRLAMTAIARGYLAATGQLMSPADIHRETKRFMLEHIAGDKATKIVMASDPDEETNDVQRPGSILDGLVDEPLNL